MSKILVRIIVEQEYLFNKNITWLGLFLKKKHALIGTGAKYGEI
jgi:hypothetical protein